LLQEYYKLEEANDQLRTELRQSKKISKKWKTLSEQWKERAREHTELAAGVTQSSSPVSTNEIQVPTAEGQLQGFSTEKNKNLVIEKKQNISGSPSKMKAYSAEQNQKDKTVPCQTSKLQTSPLDISTLVQDTTNHRKIKINKVLKKGFWILARLPSLRKPRGRTVYYEGPIIEHFQRDKKLSPSPREQRLNLESTENFETLKIRSDSESKMQQYSMIKSVLESSKHTFDTMDDDHGTQE
jgi:hypothetical protein